MTTNRLAPKNKARDDSDKILDALPQLRHQKSQPFIVRKVVLDRDRSKSNSSENKKKSSHNKQITTVDEENPNQKEVLKKFQVNSHKIVWKDVEQKHPSTQEGSNGQS